jgi:hypothetical protein
MLKFVIYDDFFVITSLVAKDNNNARQGGFEKIVRGNQAVVIRISKYSAMYTLFEISLRGNYPHNDETHV